MDPGFRRGSRLIAYRTSRYWKLSVSVLPTCPGSTGVDLASAAIICTRGIGGCGPPKLSSPIATRSAVRKAASFAQSCAFAAAALIAAPRAPISIAWGSSIATARTVKMVTPTPHSDERQNGGKGEREYERGKLGAR